jgi:hypothetical protein
MPTPFRALLAATALAVFAGGGTSGAAAVAAAPRVTLISDSVGGVLFWQQDARDELARGIDLRVDIRTCRRLVTDGCVYGGERPPSALDAIRDLAPTLGQVAVIDVGYNDAPSGFAAGIDRVMRALLDAGVDQVVWITLREGRPSWAEINDEIRQAPKRWPQLTVGDWELESRAHDGWFADGIHMNWNGGEAFGGFLRPLVIAACGTACGNGGSMLTVGGSLRRPATRSPANASARSARQGPRASSRRDDQTSHVQRAGSSDCHTRDRRNEPSGRRDRAASRRGSGLFESEQDAVHGVPDRATT